MKNNTFRLKLAICALILFVGCELDREDLNPEIVEIGKDQKETEKLASEESSIDPEEKKVYLKYLEKIGFADTEVVFNESELIVEGDMVFSYVDISTELKKSGNKSGKQRYSTRPTSAVFNRPVLYFVDRNVPNNWQDAFEDATVRWANLPGTDIRFTETFNSSLAQITLTTLNTPLVDGRGTIADARLPSNTRSVGHRIRVNVNSEVLARSGTNNQRLSTMMHEIGHAVGFRHTNGNGDDRLYFSGSLARCTDDMDVQSIMSRQTLTVGGRRIPGRTRTNPIFTFQDQLAITTLFRSTNPIITGFRGQVNTTPRSRSFRIDWNRNRVAGSTVRIRLLQNLQNPVRNIPRQSPLITTANDGSHTMFFRDLTGVIGTNERRRIDYSCLQIEFLSGNTIIDRTQAFSVTGSFSNPSDNPRDGDIADPDGNIF